MADQGRDTKVGKFFNPFSKILIFLEGFGKKGMYTSNAKKGFGNTTTGHLFSKPFEHMTDPYDNKRNIEIVYFDLKLEKNS